MKNIIINTKIVVAFIQCPRKAFLLLFSKDKGKNHQYMLILEKQKRINRKKYLDSLKRDNKRISFYRANVIDRPSDFLIEATLKTHDFEAYCDVITKASSSSSSGRQHYEPTIVIGTYTITKEQKIELAFAGYVLRYIQKILPAVGNIVDVNSDIHRVKLDTYYKKLRPIIKTLKEWIAISYPEQPPVILNRNCLSCQFRDTCRKKVEEDDDLSLLDRMTAKLIPKYHKKGIFTVTQLSYLFKPRRKRKRTKNANLHFKPELQALAIRTEKIYIQELPDIHRHHVELFLDIEGVPDQNFHYLIGLVVCKDKINSYHFYWADSIQDEEQIWKVFLKKINEYPNAPIYHYGSYESKAIDKLTKSYQTSNKIKERLVNINPFIYGKVYFPLRSNNLKELGKFVGASWTASNASGLQSLVWRHQWEETKNENFKKMLITYNKEDCKALQLLTDYLTKIKETADSQENIDFANKPKQNTTERGDKVHRELEHILKTAHANYHQNRISIQSKEKFDEIVERKKRGAPKGHQGYIRLIPSKIGKNIRVPMRRKCPKHKGESLQKTEKMAEKIIIDLHFTKNGLKKTVTKYKGTKGYCKKCYKHYNPRMIKKFHNQQLFGHGFKSFAIYSRMVLRLPYRIINQTIEDLFGERMSSTAIVGFIRQFAKYYTSTEKILVKRILESPFVHVDETRISIDGTEQYIWVFTDGKHVVFRLTETRETTVVHEFLSGYEGVLISDFYPGYDSIKCHQQKCWVHLIRDINDDLWKSPFNTEFETFVSEVKNLIAPIFKTIGKYGSMKWHLNKFKKHVEQFYKKNIIDKDYESEITRKYQKRFRRYKKSLFTSLDQDFIPWNNNTAERAIRHLAVQRKISGRFFEDLTHKYLLLLGIAQTCKFQDKSFLKFLISKEKDVDKFKSPKHQKYSKPVTTNWTEKKS